VELTQDPQNPDRFAAKLGLETLHIDVHQETPPDKMAKAGEHYGITRIEEFPISEARKFLQMEAVTGILGGVAGQGATNNLQTVIGGMGEHQRMTPMQRKVQLLPIARNPHQVSRQSIIRLWPVRQDPVVRARLELIAQDGRYDIQIQRTAKDVLTEKVDETELIAVGVAD
jgi:hypothetical protein